MPNWCYTSYAVEGPKEQLQKLNDLMNHVASMSHPGLIKNDFGSSWLGNLVSALGVDPLSQPELRCRGEYYNVDLNQSGYMTFDTMTAWCEADGTRHLIEKKFPGVRLFFISEEFGCEYWETNDVQGKHFRDRYYFSWENSEDGDSHYLETIEELVDLVSEVTGASQLSSFEECEQVLENCANEDFSYMLLQIKFENSL